MEAALAHVVQNKVEAAYARSDVFERRRQLMDDWVGSLPCRHTPSACPGEPAGHGFAGTAAP